MIIALNNKCNLNKEEYIEYIEKLNNIDTKETLILCPNYLNIPLTNLKNASLASQNVSSYENGAYTGEISASILKSYNVEYSIIGHSERRGYQKESNDDIKKKITELLKYDITPILCIGESLDERKNCKVFDILNEELETALNDLEASEREKIIIAYEPIWAIGTGLIPTLEEIEEVFQFIKEKYKNNKVLYGGSANEENIDMLKKCQLIDGYLLGGLSLKIDKLETFIQKLN